MLYAVCSNQKRDSILLFLFIFLTSYFTTALELDTIGFIGIFFSLLLTLWMGYEICSTLWDSWLGVWLGYNVDFRQMGSWAVVTGATDGIGLEYSRQLAKKGINILLISRSLRKLEDCARQIETEFGVKTKVVQVDFSQSLEFYENKLEMELSGKKAI
jgi:hypothetical protein